MNSLSPDFLAQLRALMQGTPQGTTLGGDAGDGSYQLAGGGPNWSDNIGGQNWNINHAGIAHDTGDNYTDNFNPDGTYRDRSKNTGGNYYAGELAKAAAAAAAMYFGGTALMGEGGLAGSALGGAGEAGMGVGGSAGGGALAGSGGGMTLADLGIASIPEVGGMGSLGGAAGMAGSGAGFVGEGAASGVPAWDAALTKAGGSGLLGGLSGVADAIPWKNLLGAGLGALSSQDQTQSKQAEPWAAAQPFLKSLLGQGQAMSDKYAAEPFSPQQKTAYNNVGGLLNTMNQNAGSMMTGMQANATGANNYDRANPRKALTGSSFDMSSFLPQLLQFFPPGGK